MYREYSGAIYKKYDSYIEASVAQLKIAEVFKPYIAEILKRRYRQYGFGEEEITTDINTLLHSLLKIEVVDQVSLSSSSAIMEYSPTKKSIKIGNTSLDKDPASIFEFLTHEVYHALARDPETYVDRISGNANIFTGDTNSALAEIIVERAAYKTVFETTPYNAFFNVYANGYTELTFVLDAIEAAYGVNEQDLLSHSIQSRDKQVEFLSSTVGEDKNETIYFLDNIAQYLAKLFNIIYSHPDDLPRESIDIFEIVSCLASLKKACLQKVLNRSNQLTNDSSDENGIYQSDLVAFDYNKLRAVFIELSRIFSDYIYKEYNRYSRVLFLITNNEELNRLAESAYSSIQNARARRSLDANYSPYSTSNIELDGLLFSRIAELRIDASLQTLPWDNSAIQNIGNDLLAFYNESQSPSSAFRQRIADAAAKGPFDSRPIPPQEASTGRIESTPQPHSGWDYGDE